MGFGYLLLGFLTAFLLSMAAGALGLKSLALILGILLMFLGLSKLSKFHRAFIFPTWILLPMLILALYWLLADISTMFLLSLPLTADNVKTVAEWADFAITVLFQLGILYAIRMLAESVELRKLSASALRNTLFVGIYAMLYFACNLSLSEQIMAYVILAMNFFNLVWIVCNLWLIVNCMKCIGFEGEEENPSGGSRFSWLNRINDAYEREHSKLNEQSRADGEEFMRRRQEKKKNKGKKKK